MNIAIRPFAASDADAWDAFCHTAHQATLLHTRRFLSYHGDRFEDRSLLIEDAGRCLGLFPAAASPEDARRIVSHPGLTYGGILHDGGLKGDAMLEALDRVTAHYAGLGFTRLTYKAVPAFYHRVPAQDDLYALCRIGARRSRCDLSSIIDLHHRQATSRRRQRSLAKARKADVAIQQGSRLLAPFWPVLEQTLADRHGVTPVHRLDEIVLLAERFPSEIRCICGLHANQVVAGVVLFVTPMAVHAQYLAASEVGFALCALDAVLEHCIGEAQREGQRWFDFGISTESAGRVLNQGLYNFKSEFGGGSAVHEFLELDINP
jgi:hypothetical protein